MAIVLPADGRFAVYLYTQANDSADYMVKDFCQLYPTDFEGPLAADEVTITFKVIGAQ